MSDAEIVRARLGLDPDAPCHYEDKFPSTPPHTFGEAHLGTDEHAVQKEAVAALDRLESQNQALQERIETAARYVGKMNHTLSREGWHTSQHCARCDLEPLLSPTQETDLNRCPTCHASFREYSAYIAAGRANHYCLDPWHKTPRPTQEADAR